eukprot:gene9619-7533_t
MLRARMDLVSPKAPLRGCLCPRLGFGLVARPCKVMAEKKDATESGSGHGVLPSLLLASTILLSGVDYAQEGSSLLLERYAQEKLGGNSGGEGSMLLERFAHIKGGRGQGGGNGGSNDGGVLSIRE